MSNTQQMFNAGQSQGQAEAQTEEWVQSVKGTAKEAQDKTIDAAQSTSDSAQEGKNQTAGFLHQTGEQMMNMAQGAVETVKNTLGVGEKK